MKRHLSQIIASLLDAKAYDKFSSNLAKCTIDTRHVDYRKTLTDFPNK